jgi:hypothetical protein
VTHLFWLKLIFVYLLATIIAVVAGDALLFVHLPGQPSTSWRVPLALLSDMPLTAAGALLRVALPVTAICVVILAFAHRRPIRLRSRVAVGLAVAATWVALMMLRNPPREPVLIIISVTGGDPIRIPDLPPLPPAWPPFGPAYYRYIEITLAMLVAAAAIPRRPPNTSS